MLTLSCVFQVLARSNSLPNVSTVGWWTVNGQYFFNPIIPWLDTANSGIAWLENSVGVTRSCNSGSRYYNHQAAIRIFVVGIILESVPHKYVVAVRLLGVSSADVIRLCCCPWTHVVQQYVGIPNFCWIYDDDTAVQPNPLKRRCGWRKQENKTERFRTFSESNWKHCALPIWIDLSKHHKRIHVNT